MTQQERDIFGKNLTSVAFLYGHELPKERASMFISALLDFVPARLDEYLGALKKYTEDPKNRTFPNPSQLRPYLRPELSIESKADEVSMRIKAAITKFGWPDPEGAKAYIGEVGWTIIERSGGWTYICQNHGVDLNPLTFHAQAKNSAKAILESASLGQSDQPIGISHREKRESLAGLSKSNEILDLMSLSLISPKKMEPT